MAVSPLARLRDVVLADMARRFTATGRLVSRYGLGFSSRRAVFMPVFLTFMLRFSSFELSAFAGI